jgi:dGTPase
MDLTHIRERLEARENDLSRFASRVVESKGRANPEEAHAYRTEYQRDRDRVIHTNSFRRLKHKSQVFLAPKGDHYTTRLTHTIEVQQVARTIARSLNLNEDLVEATAMAHDLGHTPFGHVGEKVLDQLLDGGFHHSRHSVRIVEKLERSGRGLNLTHEVIEGIRRHSKPQGNFLSREAVYGMPLEAQIVRISDAIAYLAHDIKDAIRSRQITVDDLPQRATDALGTRHSQRANALITDVVVTSLASMSEAENGGQEPIISMSEELGEITTLLRDFMFERIYLPLSDSDQGKSAMRITQALFEHYVSHPNEITLEFLGSNEKIERIAADMVCGMTDDFAFRTAETISPGISANAFEGRL